MKTILIIGAGFSGVAVAVQLLRRRHPGPLRVVLVNGGERIARGMAYGTHSPDHTLNVPAGNMSALEDDAEHFLRFARAVDKGIDSGSFVSRQLYGDYLEWLLERAEQDASEQLDLQRVFRNVASLRAAPDGAGLVARLDDGDTIAADQVVLALGHFPSHPLPLPGDAVLDNERYLRDPWDAARVARIPADQPVLLLGTGLTMADMATTLLTHHPGRPIVAVSRRGLVPRPHRHGSHRPGAGGARAIWGDASTVREQLRAFRHYSRALAAQGMDWRDAMALLRPVTADIWQGYTDRERKRFLRHVQPYWDAHRHRLAPALHQRLAEAVASGAVRTFAARVIECEAGGSGVHVTLRRRGAAHTEALRVGAIINCTGPCADPRHTGNPLVEQLLRDGLMRTDRLGLGLEVAGDGALIDRDGRASDALFYIGPWLKATYWEATAVPDLRRFALALARRLGDSSEPGVAGATSAAS